MKRNTLVAVLLACGFLAAGAPLFAQTAAPQPASNWFNGKATLSLLGRDDVESSKFEEYRVVPKGVSMPQFTIQGSQNGYDFALFGQNIYQADQRYFGGATVGWLDVSFDYNQIPHNMGNNGLVIHSETDPGVWSMSANLRKALGDAIEAVSSASRTYPFYANLLAPTLAAAGNVDISGLRQRGDFALDLGRQLPFDLTFTYLRELKSGYRGASGGTIYGAFTGGNVNTTIDVAEPLDELTQDIGVKWAYSIKSGDAFKGGHVYATYNRNLYNDRAGSLLVDNPFRWNDVAYPGNTNSPSGSAQARFSTAPDNEANRGSFGAFLKFQRQTRVTADIAFSTWTQNEAFLPFTTNSVVLTTTGTPASSLAALPQASLDGKIGTTMLNFGFFSRPADGLGIRVRYRSYEYKDKSARFFIPGDTAQAPEAGRWYTNTATEEDPYGHATANRTDASTGRFDAQVSYDIKDLTIEGAFRNIGSSWVGRQASSGTDGSENAFAVSAVYHSSEWLDFRATLDRASRSVSGVEPGSIAAVQGVMADHAERDSTRVGLNVELTPSNKVGVTFAYFRRNDDFPNRPNESSTVADTQSGLLEASYDTYTIEAEFTPNEKAEISAYYTYEKNAQTNQWVSFVTGTTNVNNLLNYAGTDKGNTFGANAVIHFVPAKWTFTLGLSHQKIDGLMDITSNTSGATGCCSFYNGRATLTPPGAQDITDLDDTEWTTALLDLAYTPAKAWTINFGYAYDKYTMSDAYRAMTTNFPQSVLLFMKGNDGNYTANIVYSRLTYRF